MIRLVDRICITGSKLLKNMNLLAAGPARRTVGMLKSDSFETGPYLWTRSRIHRSVVFPRIARMMLTVWPITGRPKEPGGKFARHGFFALVTRWIPIDEAVTMSATTISK
jgi:hypothetical protein